MSPENKLHLYVTVSTITVMYIIIEHIVPIFTVNNIAKPLVVVASAVGVYNSLARISASLIRKSLWIKKHLLGAAFLNGTWVGEYTENGEKIITFEFFEQSISSLVIRGEAYHASGEPHAKWKSQATSINCKAGVLTYTYSCDPDKCNSTIQGVCVFNFVRGASHIAPTEIYGYAVDVKDGLRQNNREKKLTDKILSIEEAYNLLKIN